MGRLYRSGKSIATIRISDDVSEFGSQDLYKEQLPKLELLLKDFLHWDPITPSTARGIAEFLAPLSRLLRDEVTQLLDAEDGTGQSPLRRLANEWIGLLFPKSDDAQFADAYAQTLTFALLLARFEGAKVLTPEFAKTALLREHSLLSEAIGLLEVVSVRDKLLMSIELLERAIGAIDARALKSGGDPWIYFYEQFLGKYDRKLRKERGVYYTPVEVVHAQTRLAAHLLEKRFQKPLAFADGDVTVLDPAVGTGTYPLAVIEHAKNTVTELSGEGEIPESLRGLAGRLNGFEILVGPYSVAHLRVSQALRSSDVTDVTPKIYLTDTLESPNELPEFTVSILQERLNDERTRAQRIKKDARIFVCIGNPPYRRYSEDEQENTGGWVRWGDEGQDTPAIFDDFTAPVREARGGLHLQTIYNDYVYFWRWALWKVFESTQDAGIVTFITASSYLRGPGFSGMRRKMRQVFDHLWIIDLEGSSTSTRKTENVFDITIPVAIAIGVRDGSPNPDAAAKVYRTRLTGSRDEKLAKLDSICSLEDLEWDECSRGWDQPFYSMGTGAYFDWPTLSDIFPLQYTGTVLYRTWPIGETKEVLLKRWRTLTSASRSRKVELFKESRDRKVNRRYLPLMGGTDRLPAITSIKSSESPPIERYAFRSFDRQFIIADSRIGDFMRPIMWQAHGPRQMYMTTLLTHELSEGPAATATALIPDQHHFRGSYGDKGIIPMWRDSGAVHPNVTNGLLSILEEEWKSQVTPERLFAYTYGILAQTAYVDTFWSELEQPPLRLPITKDPVLFDRVADHGERILYLHTYGERFVQTADGASATSGSARYTKAISYGEYPEGFSYDPVSQTIHVGDGEFAPVTPEVWNYSVSGLQVVKSWLDYRKLNGAGRKSSPLNDIRPDRWDFGQDLLNLLWLIEATLDLQPKGEKLLKHVCASDIFSRDDLPTPTEAERKPTASGGPKQPALIDSAPIPPVG